MRIAPDIDGHPLRSLWRTRALGAGSSELVWNGTRPKFSKTAKGAWRYAGEETWQDLWAYVTKRVDREPMSEEGLEGLAYEAEIKRLWEVHPNGFAGEKCDVIDDEYDFLRAQIDSLSWEGDRAVDFKLVRGKDKKKKIAQMKNTNCILEGDPWWTNAQHQLKVLGLERMDYYVLIDGIEEKHFIVRRNQEWIDEYVMRCREFMGYVRADEPPPNQKLKVVRDNPSNRKE